MASRIRNARTRCRLGLHARRIIISFLGEYLVVVTCRVWSPPDWRYVTGIIVAKALCYLKLSYMKVHRLVLNNK